jgi:DNA invertase Pin-like site-specific DNA recombinase
MRHKTDRKRALISYCRVSTAEQGSSRLGLEAQRDAIRRYADQNGLVIFAEIEEVVSTRRERPQFEAALKLCEEFGHTLAVARLDRLSRDLLTIAQLQKSAVDFVAVDMPGASKFMVQILAAVAENERDMISERTKAALARAKANGKRLGPPDPMANVAASVYGRSVTAEEFRSKIRPRIQEMRTARVTLQQIADTFNREGIPTPSGSGQWSPATVFKALKTPNGLNLGPGADAPARADAQPANDQSPDIDSAGSLPLFSVAS